MKVVLEVVFLLVIGNHLVKVISWSPYSHRGLLYFLFKLSFSQKQLFFRAKASRLTKEALIIFDPYFHLLDCFLVLCSCKDLLYTAFFRLCFIR